MKYETKYSIGDMVWGLGSDYTCKIIECVTCQGVGTVNIGEEKFMCPKCEGTSAHPQYAGHKAFIRTEGSVGKVDIQHQPLSEWSSKKDKELRISYMLSSTGVGSGQVWDEDDLFPSRELAQAECNRRNGLIDWANTAETKQGFKDQFGGWKHLPKAQ
jgi:hypothetical protein